MKFKKKKNRLCDYFKSKPKYVKRCIEKPIAEGVYESKLKVSNITYVRNGRGNDCKVIGILEKGTIIDCYYIAKDKDGELWVSFKYSNEIIGYCLCRDLCPINLYL